MNEQTNSNGHVTNGLGHTDELAELGLDSNIPQKLPVDQLLFRLTSNDDSLTPAALYAFSDLSRFDMNLVQEHWSDIAVERRRWAVQQLCDLAEREIDLHLGRILRIALRDPDEHIRETAVAGLWEDMGTDLGEEYLRMLRKESSDNVRTAIADTLGNFVLAGELDELDPSLAARVEDVLLSLLHDTDEPISVRSHALASVAYSGDNGIRQLIEDGYYSPHEVMRISALKAMGRSADIRWRSLVHAELQNPSPLMRAEAAKACGELGARSAMQSLLFLLQDDAPVVRLAAIFALGRIGGKDAGEALNIIMEEGSEDEQEAAELALEDMTFYANPDGVSLFDESGMLDDDDDELEEWEKDPWDLWIGSDEEDLGIYED